LEPGEPEEFIDFMIKYRDWVAIKRMGIRQDTKPHEIVFHLAGIRGSIDKRAYSLLGIKTAVIDAFAASLTAGQRKSYDSLSTAIASLGKPEAKRVIDEACGENKDLKPLAETYLLDRTITGIGYDTFLNQQAMSKIWKELKLPKQRGRKAKKEEPGADSA
jgi:hypothetical protein